MKITTNNFFKFFIFSCMLFVNSAWAVSLAPYFPEGAGAKAKGGAGGDIYHVTSLEDNGAKRGTLRHAIQTAQAPRIIVFDVSGDILLKENLVIKKPFLTIDGSSSPKGVRIRDYSVVIKHTHDVIFRYMEVRVGDKNTDFLGDGLWVTDAQNIMIDHVSVSWSFDENISVTMSSDVTVQWSISSEALEKSNHEKESHGCAMLIAYNTGLISVHHNLFAHNPARNPKVANGQHGAITDIRNNVFYNFSRKTGYANNGESNINFVNNYYKPGLSTKSHLKHTIFHLNSAEARIYQKGNIMEGFSEGSENPHLMFLLEGGAKIVKTPFKSLAIKEESAMEAYAKVLKFAGAAPNKVDKRIKKDVINGTGKIINSQKEVE